MNFEILNQNSKEEVTSLFTSVFSASEGENEGELIGKLASGLSSRIDNAEIISFGVHKYS